MLRDVEVNDPPTVMEKDDEDEQDSTRADSPLRYDESYTVIDTSDIPIAEVVEAIVKRVRALC